MHGLLLSGALALFSSAAPAEAKPEVDPFDQSGIPLEVEPTDPNAVKVVLIAGRQSHGPGDHEFFAGTVILCKMLRQNGVFPVMARDGWPKNEKIFEGAKAVVFYMDGRRGHPLVQGDRMALIQREIIDKGGGFVNLHYAVDYDKKPGETILKWLGGFYDAEISINPHWDGDFKALPEHPVTRGVKPFKIRDEWYYNMRWNDGMKGVTPILKSAPPDNTRRTKDSAKYPGREEITAWTFEAEDGHRGFGFTGGHKHANWGNEDFRRLVTNAILWTAKVDVPAGGAKADFDAAELFRHMDRKAPPKPKPMPAEKK
jgi:hypothetical protein